MTIAEKMAAARGHPSGFDYLRLVLAAWVIFIHGFDVTQGLAAGRAVEDGVWRTIALPVVPMFFAVSGFLVGRSLTNCRSLISFLGFRALRIFPALAGEIVVTALVLGPIITTLSLSNYFASPDLTKYLSGVFGVVQTYLPGVFSHNPWPSTVNAQLWTVPYELLCYIILSVLAIAGIAKRRHLLFAVAMSVQLAFAAFLFLHVRQLNSGRLSMLCFLFGIVFQAYSDVIRLKLSLFVASIVVCLVLGAWPGGEFLTAIPLVYVTVYLGMLQPARWRVLLSGDYSYGMYVYGFVIQQLLVLFGPRLPWYANALVSTVIAFLVAHVSWRFVEKPALGLKQRLLRLETRLLAASPSTTR